MREWGEIEVSNSLNVIGRGLVFVTSIDADPGDPVVWKGVTWRVKDVEFMRNGMGDGGFRSQAKKEPSPEAYIYVYTELIERLERERASIDQEFWMLESCLVMEKYSRELEKWKNHILVKG